MRARVVCLLLLCAAVGAGQSNFKGIESISIAGNHYIRLTEWARASGFQLSWPQKGEPLHLSNHSRRLEFLVDSRKSIIDGALVWLSLPVLNRGGVALVSLVDVQSCLEPIVFPRKLPKPLSTICLDAGHGGKDSGEIDSRYLEKKYTLLLALELAAVLKERGFHLILTRKSDEFVELTQRAALARHGGADLFVSLHYNASVTPVRGVEVYCLTPAGINSSQQGGGRGGEATEPGNNQDGQNIRLAWEVQKALVHSLPLEDRGVKRARYEVLCQAVMPAILIEGGYMTDPSDAKRIYDARFRKRMAVAIADGISAWGAAGQASAALTQKSAN